MNWRRKANSPAKETRVWRADHSSTAQLVKAGQMLGDIWYTPGSKPRRTNIFKDRYRNATRRVQRPESEASSGINLDACAARAAK